MIVTSPQMPIFTRARIFLVPVLLLMAAPLCQASELPSLSKRHYQWLGERVFANECNQQLECLVHWNDGENFPSLGIGHFIWYAEGQSERFEETFPQLLAFLQQRGIELPTWLEKPLQADNPWPNRLDFQTASGSHRMQELRQLLQATKDGQAAFIVRRLDNTAVELLESVPESQQDSLRQVFTSVANSSSPLGTYALIDYLHFKGSGLNPSERYRQQGWGLKQVLLRLNPATANVENFVEAATDVLTERVLNAPVERNEQRWLPGWHKRLQTYLQAQ
ncbi:MAG: hypothetical protein OXD01_03855 [Gammaproteobacteria bacterium]|nr:hypothetical protein [Gammaproteobacteria bacterium]